jgi:hypothetical protein
LHACAHHGASLSPQLEKAAEHERLELEKAAEHEREELEKAADAKERMRVRPDLHRVPLSTADDR